MRRALKKTKRRDWNIFKGSKYIEKDFKEDRQKLVDFYNEHGYRDARILDYHWEKLNDNRIVLYIKLFEGHPYYFRNIRWVGNTIYDDEFLTNVLGIKKGDVYDKSLLEKRLTMDEDA
ncbi:MAG: outer membrane protein assembly factor BamA, partial [Bacteroidales bacterium]|nr:outer membrane protein assembly factor BamA [Bacteroidales bacterium]